MKPFGMLPPKAGKKPMPFEKKAAPFGKKPTAAAPMKDGKKPMPFPPKKK